VWPSAGELSSKVQNSACNRLKGAHASIIQRFKTALVAMAAFALLGPTARADDPKSDRIGNGGSEEMLA
jgi:hypothetical protein